MANYEESIEAKTKRLTATFEELSANLLNSDTVKSSLDVVTGIVSVLSTVIGKLGIVKTVLISIAAIKIADGIGIFSGIASQGKAFTALLGNLKGVVALTDATSAVQQVANADFRTGTVTSADYALALGNVSNSQAVILKSQGLTANFAKQVLMEHGATEGRSRISFDKSWANSDNKRIVGSFRYNNLWQIRHFKCLFKKQGNIRIL